MRPARQRPRPPRRSDRFAVVMAGGTGTRFWPRSRRHLPKQLLRFDGAASLLQRTVDRLRGLVPYEQILVVTQREHAAAVRRQLPELPRANVVVEPTGRNTAPCLALAALVIERRAPAASIVSLPADHAIADPGAFRRTLLTAFAWAAREPAAVTIGVRPRHPETGYGYLRLGARLVPAVHEVEAFVEKPNAARARRFVAGGRYLWNSGIFVWQLATLLALFDRHLPRMVHALRRARAVPPPRRAAALARAYARMPAISIDYGVMESARRVLVVAGEFGWSDVGSWAAAAALRSGARDGPVVPVGSSGYVVFGSERLVALVGVQDLIVVDTPDAVLICHRGRAQDVRRVVEEIERRGLTAYL